MSRPKTHPRPKSPRGRASRQISRTPSHLYLKDNFYYFRFCLNGSQRQRLGHSEIRLNLATGHIRRAKNLAGPLYCQLLTLLGGPEVLDYKEIKRRLYRYLQQLLEVEQNNISPPINYDKLSEAAGYEFNPTIVAEAYARICDNASKGSPQDLSKHAVEILETLLLDGVFTFDELTPANPMLIVKTYLQVMSSFQTLLAKRAEGDYISEDHILMQNFGSLPGEAPSSNLPSPQPLQPSLLYSEACELFIERKKIEKRWKETTWADHTYRLNCFELIIGDKPIAHISRDDIYSLQDTLQKLPPRWNRDPKYAGKTPGEIISLAPSTTLNVKTINEITRTISSFFTWCATERKLDYNPAERIQIKDDRPEVGLRYALSINELISIFSHPTFADGEFKNPAYFWIPVISLYTGMRLEEISQLHCTDLDQVDGIWVIDVNANPTEDSINSKTLKTKSAVRIIPIHSNLIEIGLLKYHQQIADQKHVRLFPLLNKTTSAKKYGKQAGTKFNSVVAKVLENSDKKSFHSLRHTFADFYKKIGAMNQSFDEVFGHQHSKLAAKQYGGRIPPNIILKDVISKLDYGPELLNILKKSPFTHIE